MNVSIDSMKRLRRLVWPAALVMATFMMTLALYPSSPIHAEEPTPEPPGQVVSSTPPLGDCYDGVLSGEPMHCYLLERAEAQDLIHIEAIYDIEDRLAIYLRESDAISDETAAFFKEKATYFYEQWPALGPQGPVYEECQRDFSYEDCLLNLITIFSWDPSYGTLRLPWAGGYTAVLLHIGGADSRRSQGGWASWEQLWPVVGLQGTLPGNGEAGTFDISDVDLTNFPQLDRAECTNPPNYITDFCYMWVLYPQSGVAGYYSVGYEDEGVAKVHLYVKTPPGDEAQLDAVKARLTLGYWKGDEVVVIPFNYDYEELWRWATILNRFALSAGNTIGVGGASVFENRGGGGDWEYVWPVEGFGPTRQNRERRPTIELDAIDHHAVAAALPTLLPQLGIPIDAVGVVRGGDSGRLLTGKVVAVGDTQQGASAGSENSVGDGELETNDTGTESNPLADASMEQGGTASAPVVGASQPDKPSERAISNQNEETLDSTSSLLVSSDVAQGISEEITQLAEAPSDTGSSAWMTGGVAGAAGLVVLAAATLVTLRLRRRAV